MKINEIITELRQGLLRFVKQSFPSWPDYVITDWIYKNLKGAGGDMPDNDEAIEFITMIKQVYGQLKWKLEQLEITLDIFDPETQQRIKQREGGTSNPFGVPKDKERHAQQQKMLQQQGISKEPIIVAKTPQGYELIEGWHRTTQYLKAYPEGYIGPAWVGVGPIKHDPESWKMLKRPG